MLALLAALSVAAAPPCGLPPLREGPLPFAPGELLSYDVDLLGLVRAGTLTLGVEPPISRGSLLPLRARLRNTSILARARPMKAYALSWVDVVTLRPQRYRDEAEEDGVRKSTDTRLDAPGPLTMSWSFGDKNGTTEYAPQSQVLDLVSMVFYLRAARLTPGEDFCFDLVANRRFWRLRGSVAPGSERLESAAGSFDTIRIDAVLTRTDGSGRKRPIHFWLSKGRRKLPVAAVSEIDLGPVRAMLARASHASTQPAD
jgi:Protein of unknown function (DUF3108)